jgi:hypothetical protein
MLATDRMRARPGAGSALALAATVAVGWYLHFSFVMILAPMLGMVVFGDDASACRPDARRKTLSWTAALSPDRRLPAVVPGCPRGVGRLPLRGAND